MAMAQKPLALAFIFLMLGHQVHVVNAMRAEDAMLAALEREIPSSDKGCTRKGGLRKGYCVPEEFCEYKKAWGGLKRTCRLKTMYRADEELATKFGSSASSLLEKSEVFRAKGSFSSLYKLTNHMEVVGKCQAAVDSEEPTPKPLLKGLEQAFATQTVQDFEKYLQEQKASLPDLKVFSASSLPAEAQGEKALKRLIENIEEGAKGSVILRRCLAEVNVEALLSIQGKATPPTKEDVKKVFPKASDEKIDEALKEATEEVAKVGKDCGGDEACLKKARLESEGQNVDVLTHEANAKDEELTESLLQKLEALGHKNIRVQGNATASGVALLEFLDSNMEHLQAHEDIMVEVQGKGKLIALVALALIIGLGFLCGPASVFCWTFFIFMWFFVVVNVHGAGYKKKMQERQQAAAEADEAEEGAEGAEAAEE